MIDPPIMRARKPIPKRLKRKPRPVDSPNPRVCARTDCDTRLSMYNHQDFCYTHQPIQQPRVRGRKYNGKEA